METVLLILCTVISTVITTLLTIRVYHHLSAGKIKVRENDSKQSDMSSETGRSEKSAENTVRKNDFAVSAAPNEETENQLSDEDIRNLTPESEIGVINDKVVEDKRELTVKERFYLFLEKGFCPELEENVEDPMYKYAGGAIKDSKFDVLDPIEGLCPFQSIPEDESSVDDENGETSHDKDKSEPPQPAEKCDQNKFTEEISSLEQMLKIGMKNNGKCPFMTATKQSCPFDFGMKEDVDSEEEADMPVGHGKNGPCPAIHREAHMVHQNLAAQSQAKQNQAFKTAFDKDEVIGATTSSNLVRNTMERLETNLTDKERDEEAMTRMEQMAAIMKLLHEQETKVGMVSELDLTNQLKMYI